ncbi:hypothetical protein MTBLM1_20081 [Rhodospirillaceae bacterium LM-1]|nr:hypothetical protein MTBLM1_20081 [Rhodospirillaceae bacterium LM-1]
MSIFHNPMGAPELACDNCGCRWFDRMTNCCYECGQPVTEDMVAEFQAALAEFDRQRAAELGLPGVKDIDAGCGKIAPVPGDDDKTVP